MTAQHADTIALITGGTQGLGYAVAQRLIDEGCTRLALVGRDVAKGKAAAAALSVDGVEVIFLAADLGDVGRASAIVDETADHFGRVTALVSSAATTERASILNCSPAEFDRQFAINTRGPFFALQRFAQRAIAAGHEGSVVNILSILAHGGLKNLSPYSASKAALATITKNSAQALRHDRIKVNAINVGWMDTPGEDLVQRKWHDGGDDWLAKAEAKMPFGMLVKPDHVAGLVSYLLSKQSGVMTGSIIDFDQQVIGAYPEI